MTDEDVARLSSGLHAATAVMLALISTHPDRARLASEIDRESENIVALLLNSKTPDRTIDLTKAQIARFRFLAIGG